ncbi:MAG TPA: hypothetical protein VL337_13315 [Acidimicrobiales bacterium]|jgi:hypothetical protein|nr:hypothetical protein [Acidimicrobiales bacterium]
MGAVDKVVVTNAAALEAKYGDRAKEVIAGVDALVAADAGRGIRTTLVALDDAGAMGGLNAAPVTDPADPEQVKAAIDGVFRALDPDYLMILGAVDVVPHQPMRNPMPSDGDEVVPGDLPYACVHPYSDDPADFIGPTRVVGRLPDLTAADDPAYLVALLEAAAGWTSRPAADYRDYLGISAKVWEGSTTLSLQNLFGNADDLRLSPTDGPDWPDELLGRRSHFVNCHGAGADPHYYGQEGGSYPIAHDASLIDGRLREGTVAAAECCYGAELYDPALAGGVAPICNTYLASGAYAFLGSSTIAYGPADGNGSADLLCQFFLRDVLAGASVGRAALQARQAFVRDVTVVDPADLKTLAQFSLMADPSVVPVEAPAAQPKGVPGAALRSARRANLLANGLALPQSTSVARRSRVSLDDQPDLLRRILDLAGEPGLEASSAASFEVDEAPVTKSFRASLAAGDAPSPSVLHVVVHRAEAAGDGTGSTVLQNVAVIAREQGGQIVAVRKLYAR